MGPHTTDRSCGCRIEPRSRSMINRPQPNARRIDRGVCWSIAATQASGNGVPSPWMAATSPSINSGIRRDIPAGIPCSVSSHLPASQMAGQDRIVDATPGHTGPHRATPGHTGPHREGYGGPLFHAPGRFLWGWAGTGERTIKTLTMIKIIKIIQRPRGYNKPAGERLAQTAPRMRQPGGPSATTLRSPRLKPQPAGNLTHSQEGIEHSTCGGWNFRQRLAFARIVVFVC